MADIKQILGAMIFGANRPLSIREMRKCILEEAKEGDSVSKALDKVTERNIKDALLELERELEKARTGFLLKEVSGGYRLQSDVVCGRWLKRLLDKGRPDRLSHPGLETLSIIAYRQPVTKADIEAVRGVDVGHMIKTLMEMQLVKIVGRSELPGRPFLYATTSAFLDHFGLKNLKDLGDLNMKGVKRLNITDQLPLEEKEQKSDDQKQNVVEEQLVMQDESAEEEK